MAEAGSGDFELFNAPAAQEKSEVSDEQFSDEMRRTQQALAQLQQEEGQARGYDRNLASIIVQFLNQPGNTDLFLLVSRTVAQDVPSELILAIIALVDKKATEEVYALLRGGKEGEQQALAVREPSDFSSMPPEHKKHVDQWIQNIHHVSCKKPQRVLSSVVINYKASAYHPEAVREVSPVVVQLSAFILRNYLSQFEIGFNMEELRDFMQAVFVTIVGKLEALVQGQKQLNASENL
ncbi:MAG: hypothetical protein V1760_01805 [Candidatus Peregrinibacteria bacterium]